MGTGYGVDMYNKVDSTISDDFAALKRDHLLYSSSSCNFFDSGSGSIIGALIAMVHDVIVVLAVFSIFWGVLPFTMEIDQAFIAAF